MFPLCISSCFHYIYNYNLYIVRKKEKNWINYKTPTMIENVILYLESFYMIKQFFKMNLN